MANVPITFGGGGSADLDQITAGAGQILSPYKGVNSDGDAITGTILSLGATTWTPSTSAQTIASGKYLSGTQTIAAVSNINLAAGNIKKGVTIQIKAGNNTIYNVTGTWEGYIAGPADVYKQGAWGASQHRLDKGTAGTAAIIPGSMGGGGWEVDLAFGPMNAYGYTRLIASGTDLSTAGGTAQCRYKSSMPTDVTDGTSAYSNRSETSTATTYTLTPAAINAGSVYWVVRFICNSGNSSVVRIYFA